MLSLLKDPSRGIFTVYRRLKLNLTLSWTFLSSTNPSNKDSNNLLGKWVFMGGLVVDI